MPETALWAMIVSLIVLALGKALQAAEWKHSLKLMDEEFKHFLSEV